MEHEIPPFLLEGRFCVAPAMTLPTMTMLYPGAIVLALPGIKHAPKVSSREGVRILDVVAPFLLSPRRVIHTKPERVWPRSDVSGRWHDTQDRSFA